MSKFILKLKNQNRFFREHVTKLLTKANNCIHDIFSISEVAQSKVLQALAVTFLITFLITFSGWSSQGFTSKYAKAICLPHLAESCTFYKNIIPLIPLPYGYSQTIFFVFLFSFIALGMYALYIKKFQYLFIALVLLWSYKLYIVYGFDSGNYDYYDLIFVALFLFTKNKLYWLRVFFLVLYFLASTIKIHEGWILGTYFTSLETGLPIFGNYFAPVITNLVIISQMIFSWFLFKPKDTLAFKLSFFYFLFFHLYSGILVEYRFMISSLPLLVILFWLPKEVSYKKDEGFFPELLFVFILFLQLIAIIIPGDQKMTLEGNKYGLYMFEANHQCIANYTINYINSSSTIVTKKSSDAHNRCDPYDYVYTYKYKCFQSGVKSIMLTFDHSINGGPFFRIIDSENICKLTYYPFKHNTWIKLPEGEAKIIGYPVKNFYLFNVSKIGEIKYTQDNLIILPGLEKNEPPRLNKIQEFLSKYIKSIKCVYWVLWITELLCILYFFFILRTPTGSSRFIRRK